MFNLNHSDNIAGTKHLMNPKKFLSFITWKIWGEHAIAVASPS
jgi:hypothetical protein